MSQPGPRGEEFPRAKPSRERPTSGEAKVELSDAELLEEAQSQADYLTSECEAVPAETLRDLAARFEALQQRCEELSSRCLHLIGEEGQSANQRVKDQEHIAALEAALRKYGRHRGCKGNALNTDECTCGFATVLQGQALTSSEGAEDGECRRCSGEGCSVCEVAYADCSCIYRLGHRVLTPPDCPIHSPTSAAEGREDV